MIISKKRPFYAVCVFNLIVSFVSSSLYMPQAQADQMPWLPKPGNMVGLSKVFKPAALLGIRVNAQDPFKFDFILDKGDVETPLMASLRDESTKLIKYFLTTLTIPDNDIWVNLSPYEKDKIITEKFGQTEMGRNLLAQDYLLKQITASLMFPQGETGKKFWGRIYKEAKERFGSIDVPVNTFNKVWIMPDKAVVYEKMGDTQATAFVIESSLKVMLEEDYLALKKHSGTPTDLRHKAVSNQNARTSQIVREVILPQLEKEVNEGKNFAPLRQIYNSIILALWYKERMQGSILSSAYVNHSKIAGVNVMDKAVAQKIWHRYVRAYKKGVVNLIQDEQDPITHQMISRKYFSGGFNIGDFKPTRTENSAMLRAFLKRIGGVAALTSFFLVSAACGASDQLYRVPPASHQDVGPSSMMDAGTIDAGIINDAGPSDAQTRISIRETLWFSGAKIQWVFSKMPDGTQTLIFSIRWLKSLFSDVTIGTTFNPNSGSISYTYNGQTTTTLVSTTQGHTYLGLLLFNYQQWLSGDIEFDHTPPTSEVSMLPTPRLSKDDKVAILQSIVICLNSIDNNSIVGGSLSLSGMNFDTGLFTATPPNMGSAYKLLLSEPRVTIVLVNSLSGYVLYLYIHNSNTTNFMPGDYNTMILSNGQLSIVQSISSQGQEAIQASLNAMQAVGSLVNLDEQEQAELQAGEGVMMANLQNSPNPNTGADGGINDSGGDQAMAAKKGRAMRHETQVMHRAAQLNKALDTFTRGGIDLTQNATPLDIHNPGQKIHFNIDPAQIAQINKATGLTPRVFSIVPLRSLSIFLGLSAQETQKVIA